MLKEHPIDSDPRFKEVLTKAESEAEEELKDAPRGLGYCHIFWEAKKRILSEKYGIAWKTPAEINPDVDFD